MIDRNARKTPDMQVDTRNLYREEVFTDLQATSIRRLSPVTADGTPDPSRGPVYVGETTLMTQLGPLPVSFPIEAASLEEACHKFPQGVREAVEELGQRARESALDEASRILIPTGMPPELGSGSAGGKILLK